MPRKTSDTNAIDKVCRVMRHLGEAPGGRLTDIAAATDLPPGTALRVLEALTRERFVERIEPAKIYVPGPETAAFARLAPAEDLRAAARPGLARLAAAFGDAVLLTVVRGLDTLFLDCVQGNFAVAPVSVQPGERRMLGVGGAGLALLAFAPRSRAEAYLEAIPLRLGDFPRLTLDRLKSEVEAARRDGYALAIEHLHDDVSSIGVPVRCSEGETVAAISLVSLTERLASRRELIARAMLAEAARLTPPRLGAPG